MKYFSCLVAFALLGCSSSGVIPMDRDTYLITKRSAQAGAGAPVGVQADVYQEANEFCGSQGKAVETVKLDVVNTGFGRPGSVALQFRCVAKS